MSKLTNIFLVTAAFAMLNESNNNTLRPEDIDVTPKDKPIPKGCKRYYFNENGLCSIGEHKIYFDCLTSKRAYKKYEKWKNE